MTNNHNGKIMNHCDHIIKPGRDNKVKMCTHEREAKKLSSFPETYVRM